jgi:hypothetical protein
MNTIVLVDTSILLNVVNVPGRNQQRAEVLQALKQRILQNDHLFIPLAAIIETGNHIAHVDGGRLRRQAAQRFTHAIEDALKDIAPWKPLNFPNHADLLAWLGSFPDSAMRKVGMGDLSIQKEWEQLCQKFPMSQVVIWSADSDLRGFDRVPQQHRPQ